MMKSERPRPLTRAMESELQVLLELPEEPEQTLFFNASTLSSASLRVLRSSFSCCSARCAWARAFVVTRLLFASSSAMVAFKSVMFCCNALFAASSLATRILKMAAVWSGVGGSEVSCVVAWLAWVVGGLVVTFILLLVIIVGMAELDGAGGAVVAGLEDVVATSWAWHCLSWVWRDWSWSFRQDSDWSVCSHVVRLAEVVFRSASHCDRCWVQLRSWSWCRRSAVFASMVAFFFCSAKRCERVELCWVQLASCALVPLSEEETLFSWVASIAIEVVLFVRRRRRRPTREFLS